MSPALLASPLLLGTAWSRSITDIDDLASLLECNHHIQDLQPLASSPGSRPSLTLQAAMASFGDVSLVSVIGSPLTLAVAPRRPLAMLALPSVGWGQYQMDEHQIANQYGRSIAYLPARGWRLVNDNTGGTAVQFTEQALLARLEAMAGGLSLHDATPLLSLPFVVDTDAMPASGRYRTLLSALAMADHSFRCNHSAPDPFLRLDDLILRCVALLLFPQLLQQAEEHHNRFGPRDLQQTIRSLMEWMTANLHRPLSLSDIEQQASYGRRAIQLGFKAEVGCGPMQWLRRQRLQLALHALQNPTPGLTIREVSRSCGYLNFASFSRDFHERYGTTASQILRQARLNHGIQTAGPGRGVSQPPQSAQPAGSDRP